MLSTTCAKDVIRNSLNILPDQLHIKIDDFDKLVVKLIDLANIRSLKNNLSQFIKMPIKYLKTRF